MEWMANNKFYTAGKNLYRTSVALSRSMEKSFAHLRDQARSIISRIAKETGQQDILRAILTSDEAARIYRESFVNDSEKDLFAPVNQPTQAYFKRSLQRFYKLYLCDAIADQLPSATLSTLAPMVCGEETSYPQDEEKTVAFLRNMQASRAFEYFAGVLGGVSAVYESNFRQRERRVQQLCRNDQDIDKNSRRPMRRCSSIAGEVVRHSVAPEPSQERAW